MAGNLAELEQALGYSFRNQALLTRALTHSSSANEVGRASGPDPRDNERLEFLGDSVLGWLVCEWLFTHFPHYSEGQLSLLKNHLVSAAHLLAAAHRLELGQYLHLGRGEESGGGRSKQRLLSNAFEALLAAVYLDGGVEATRATLERWIIPDEEVLQNLAGAGPPHDFRAELERLTRERDLSKPEYRLVSEHGPGHCRTFQVEVRVGAEYAQMGEGPSKKAASHEAAQRVCMLLRGSAD